MATIGFENTKNRIQLTFTTNPLDARRALTVQLAGEMHTLSVVEAQDLLDWLYSQRSELYELAHAPTDEQIRAILAQPPLDDSNLDELTF